MLTVTIFFLASDSSKKASRSTVSMKRQAGQSSLRYDTWACMKPLKIGATFAS
jgi:hypothetical protein